MPSAFLHALFVCLALAGSVLAADPVLVVLWFDTEDYMDPASDDAALRIANDLSALGVRATFKVVGEKARALESRGRRDVIQALRRHDIGYHTNFHSVHPTPAEYLRHFGFVEGASEFERRESSGARDVERIFGVRLACYGQPGSSWAPQALPALRKMGIPVYLDEGDQVGLNEKPFWYGGLLHVFNMGSNQFRASLDAGSEDRAAYGTFDRAAARLRASGGGVISIYYHPTEFVNTEFWDAVNFAGGANPPRSQWKKPRARTAADAERCYGVLRHFVAHMKSVPGIRFSTASDLTEQYARADAVRADPEAVAQHLMRSITFLETADSVLSPADMVLQLLGLPARIVDGPAVRAVTSLHAQTLPREALDTAARDAAGFIQTHGRLPGQVFVGASVLSLPDFVATLAGSSLAAGDVVPVRRGTLGFEKYFSNDPAESFRWPIHPADFSPPELLELARLQGWTLKPARLRK